MVCLLATLCLVCVVIGNAQRYWVD